MTALSYRPIPLDQVCRPLETDVLVPRGRSSQSPQHRCAATSVFWVPLCWLSDCDAEIAMRVAAKWKSAGASRAAL